MALVINLFLGTLPAPNNVYYNIIEGPAEYLQLSWEPPTLVSDEPGSQNINVNVDSRIAHYIVYITTDESTTVQVYNVSGTSFAIEIDKVPCGFWFQVAAVNPAGVGEGSPSRTFDCEFACIYVM